MFSNGNTIVAAVQEGRFFDGGASDIAFSTSTNSGQTWKYGSLPGVTKLQKPAGKWDRVSDPAVTYDAKHGLWLVSMLPLTGATGQMPLVSASSDGLTWGNPVEILTNNGDFIDKDWIVCDSLSTSKYYGNCYVEFDDNSQGDVIYMSTSKDGGATWSAAYQPAGAGGLAGQPVVQPNGHVIVPFLSNGFAVQAFQSTNGGASWGNTVQVANINDHQPAGGLRDLPLPSARADDSGVVYVVWNDCSFRSGCNENDIVMSTSSNGSSWSAPARVPIDAVTSTIDHVIPGISVQPGTVGSSAHLGLAYYYYPNANCSGNCNLTLGYISSTDGGSSWTKPVKLGFPIINLAWLANTNQGYMVGDYIASVFSGSNVHIAQTLAKAPGSAHNQYLVTNSTSIVDDGVRFTSRGERPVPGAHSDHVQRLYPPGE
jgi:hypothetical protein